MTKNGIPPKACCLVSELLEEAGIDRASIRQAKRQVLEGLVMLCQWQLERMRAADAATGPGERGVPPRKGRKVTLD